MASRKKIFVRTVLEKDEIEYIDHLARLKSRSRSNMLRQIVIEHKNINEKKLEQDLKKSW